jgi:diamine N-acetyltransferase
MNPLTIRPAAAEDIPLIRSLALEIWPPTYLPIIGQDQIDYMLDLMYSEASLQEQLLNGKPFVLVYDKENPVGFASYGLLSEGRFKLYKLYVLPGQQGRGTGRFVMDYILSDIRSKGANSLELQVNKANKAKQFYEKNGFRIREEMVLEIGNGYVMDDYIMELLLD